MTDDVNNIEIRIVPTMNPDGYDTNTWYNAPGDELNRSFPEGSGPSPDPNNTTSRQLKVAVIMNWSFAHSFALAGNFHGGALLANYPFDNDNRDSMLSYMETCLMGVRGLVTDEITGAPLAATVTVEGRNHPIFTDPDVGDYHRMLMPGAYALTFAADGFDPVTIPNVFVASGAATCVDVQFWPPTILTHPNGGETLPANTPIDLTWSGSSAAQHNVQYSSNFGEIGPATEDFESGVLNPALYQPGGSQPWFVASGVAHSGSYSARAGAIADN